MNKIDATGQPQPGTPRARLHAARQAHQQTAALGPETAGKQPEKRPESAARAHRAGPQARRKVSGGTCTILPHDDPARHGQVCGGFPPRRAALAARVLGARAQRMRAQDQRKL